MGEVPNAQCDECPLRSGTLVPGRGTLSTSGTARCVIVGEGPGRQEVINKTVFIGPSGQLLSQLMEHFIVGSHWITNAGLCGVGEGPSKEAAARYCAVRLREEIASKRPALIITLGNIPTDIITQVPGKITQRRGIVTQATIAGKEYPVLPTFHPAAILRNYAFLPDLIADFKLAKQLLQAPTVSCGVINPQCDFVITEDSRMVLRKAQASTFAVLDLETSGLALEDSRILCAVIATDEGIFILPQRTVYSQRFKEELLSIPVKWSGHNAKFDRGMLLAEIGVPLRFAFDTMLAHYLIDPRQGAQEESRGAHGLKDIAQRMYNAPDWEAPIHALLVEKKSKSYADLPLPILYKYAAYDGYYQRLLTYDLAKQIAADPQKLRVFKTLLMPGMHALSNAEVRGVKIDQAGLEALKPKYKARAQEAQQKLEQIAGHELNPRSPKQVSGVMFDELHLRQLEGRSTSAKTVLKMYNNPHPFVSALLDYREAYTIVSRYLNLQDYLSHTGRVHTTFNLHRTATGRLSSTAPNTQNQPSRIPEAKKDIKDLYLADEGLLWSEADFCLHPDTWVETPKGRKRLQDIAVGDIVYSTDNRRVCLGEVTKAVDVAPLDSLRITLDNGEAVVASKEHKWLVKERRGRTVPVVTRRTDELKKGDRLLPFNRLVNKRNGYVNLYTTFATEYVKEHTLVAERFLGPKPDGYDIHHVDGDRANNLPTNLVYMNAHEHNSQHSKANYARQDHCLRKAAFLESVKFRRSYKGSGNPNYGKRTGEIRSCPVCGEEFYTTPGIHQKYCSTTCYHAAGRGGKNHTIVDISPVGLQPMRAITVEDQHNFALSCGVFTCNSQLEYRMIAILSQDPYLIQCYQGGRDLHGETAALGWGPNYTPAQRAQAKTANFSLLYGASEAGFLTNGLIDIPIPIKRKIVAGFFSRMPKVVEYNEWIRNEVRRTGIVTTPSGRVRRFPEVLIANSPGDWNMIFREAVNTPPQGGASDATLLALINLDKQGFDLRLTVHDSSVVQGPVDSIIDVAREQVRIMSESAAELYGDLIPFPAEAAIGPRWGSLKEAAL